jgi:putative oxidoreductase
MRIPRLSLTIATMHRPSREEVFVMVKQIDTARLLPWTSVPLRLFLGLSFLGHGSQKLFAAFGGPGMAGVTAGFRAMHIPAPELMAWVVALSELVGGLLLVVGLATRVAAALLSVVMIVAVLAVHLPHGFFAQHGGAELPLAYLAGLVALMVSGGGALSLDAHVPELVSRLRHDPGKRAPA